MWNQRHSQCDFPRSTSCTDRRQVVPGTPDSKPNANQEVEEKPSKISRSNYENTSNTNPNTNYFKLLINFGLGIEKPAEAYNTFGLYLKFLLYFQHSVRVASMPTIQRIVLGTCTACSASLKSFHAVLVYIGIRYCSLN